MQDIAFYAIPVIIWIGVGVGLYMSVKTNPRDPAWINLTILTLVVIFAPILFVAKIVVKIVR